MSLGYATVYESKVRRMERSILKVIDMPMYTAYELAELNLSSIEPNKEDNVSDKANLYKLILAAQQEIGSIDKDAKNDFHHYKYASAANVSSQTRKVFHSLGLILTSSMEDCSLQMIETTKSNTKTGEVTTSQSVLATVRINYCLTHTASGEFENYIFYGLGYDANDKAVNKAITAAGKYAVLQILQLATGDDPEADGKKPTTSRKKATTSKTTTPTTQSAPDGLDTSKAIWFGKHNGTAFCDLPEDYLDWLTKNGKDEALDLAKAVLAERKAPELPVNGGGNIMAEDNNPMTAKEIAELDKLFEVNYDSAFWNDFKEDRPESMTFGLFKKFKASLLGTAEAGVGFDQIEQRIAEAMRESGV